MAQAMTRTRTWDRGFAVAFVTFASYAIANWLLTSKVFPIGTAVAPLCRDIGTLVEALGFFVVALIASKRPTLLGHRPLLDGTPLLTLAGGVTLWLCAPASPVGATIGVCLLELAAIPVMLCAGCALARIDEHRVAPCVLAGLALSYLLRFVLADIPSVAGLVLFCAGQLCALAVGSRGVRASFEELRRSETPEELTLTNPFSFLPRNHQLFICLLLFQTSYGAALSYGEIDSTPLATFAGIVPLLAVCLARAALHRMPRHDTLFGWALLIVMAGFLFAPTSQQLGTPVTSNLLEAGSSCFMLVFWPALTGLARRNRVGALPLLAWSGFLLSLGVTAGAAIGRVCYGLVASSTLASTALVSLVVLGLAAYALFGMRTFSFDATVERLVASPEVQERDATPDEQTHLAAIASRHGLTAREAEIFSLLAQGRNGAHIQRQLGVSYNTVKTHVAHIYAKLGVHAHQELIDLVRHDEQG